MTEKEADVIFYLMWVLFVITLAFGICTKVSIKCSNNEQPISITKEQKLTCFNKAIQSGMAHGSALKFCEIE